MNDQLKVERDPFTFGLGDKVLTRLNVPGVVVTQAFDDCGARYEVEMPNGNRWFRPLEIQHAGAKP